MKTVSRVFLIGCVTLVACDACNEPEPEIVSEIRWESDRTHPETENFSEMTFRVLLNQASPVEVKVDFETVDGTALAGEDYVATSGTIVFSPGETNKSVVIPIIIDEYLEPTEEFSVLLSNPINGYIKIGEPTATGGIANDDNLVNIIAKYVTDAKLAHYFNAEIND